MSDLEHALAQIADIRAQMSASGDFRGFEPQAMALAAVLALCVAMAQTIWPQTLAADGARYVAVWAGALVATSIVGALAAVSRARRQHGPLAGAMLGATLRHLAPFAVAAAAIGIILCRASPAAAWYAPGLWMMLIGLVGFAEAPRLPRAIVWPAGWFLACGTVALALAARHAMLSPWVMGASLAVGQGVVAVVLQRAHGARHAAL